jgi:hypothetical protein
MLGNRGKLYDDAKAFFELDGNAVMKLSRGAAIDVCRGAAGQGIVVVKVEGGISSNDKFEARLDAIWDGADPPMDQNQADKTNTRAAAFIKTADSTYNAFVLMPYPITGYPQRQRNPRASVKRQLAEKA